MKDFVARNFSEYFKSAREKLYSKLTEETNITKVAKSLAFSLTTLEEVKIFWDHTIKFFW